MVKGCFCQPIGLCIDAGSSGNLFVNERNYKIRIKEPFILSPDNAPDTLQYGRNSNASGSSMPDAFLVRYADHYEKQQPIGALPQTPAFWRYCLFPVAGFLIAERQSTVKDALHRAAASSLTVGCLGSAEICLRDGDKTMLYKDAGKFS